MGATQHQMRKGSVAQLAAMSPVAALAEHLVDTDNNRLVVGDGARAGGWPHANFDDLQKQKFTMATTVGGTANAITLVFSPATLADSAKARIGFIPTASNSGPTTAVVDGRGAVTMKKYKSGVISDLETGDIISGKPVYATCDGTYYVLDATDLGNATQPGLIFLGSFSGAAAQYDFDSLITSSYNDYVIAIQCILPVTNNVDLQILLKRSGGGSYDSSGYLYNGQINSSAASIANYNSTSAAGIKIASGVSNSANNGNGVGGRVEGFGLPNVNRGLIEWKTGHFITGSRPADALGSGYLNQNAALQGILINFSSGNIASGKATLYGLTQS